MLKSLKYNFKRRLIATYYAKLVIENEIYFGL